MLRRLIRFLTFASQRERIAAQKARIKYLTAKIESRDAELLSLEAEMDRQGISYTRRQR